VKSSLVSEDVRSVCLMPFMSVAGDHARNDLLGEDPDSWKSQLEALGLECVPIPVGMGELPGVVDIWMNHLETAMNELKEAVSSDE